MTEETKWLGLEGRVCVVTGAGSGIGEEVARSFAAAGARVAIIDRAGEAATRVASSIEAAGGRAIALAVDVSDAAAMQEAALHVERELGLCHVLVSNAGVQYAEPLLQIDLARWRAALDINLTGALVCTQAFVPQMIRAGEGGSIVCVGSVTGDTPRANGGAYSSSKAGLSMLARQLAVELGVHGIRSNTVAPGYIRTPLSERNYQIPEVAQARERMVPLGRIGITREVADVILFLASHRSAYVSGQTLAADGGLTQTLLSLAPRPPGGS